MTALKPARVILYAILLVTSTLWGAPFVWMIVTSLKPENEIFRLPIRWLPDNPTLKYFFIVFTDFPMMKWFFNSLIVASITTILTVTVDALAAYPLARLEFPGRRAVMVTVLATCLLPYELLFVPLFLGLSKFGLSDSFFSLSVPASANAFGVFLLTQFFKAVPKELEEAAIIDGCSRMDFFWRILLPLTTPGLATVAIFSFVGSWNNFFWPLIVTNSDATRTLPVGLATFIGSAGMSMNQGVAMAATVVATIPAVVFFLMLQRYFVRSVATTGVKG